MKEEQRLGIEWACEKLGRQFANFSDQSDFRSLAELFTEDAVYVRPSVPDQEICGRETIYQEFLKRPPLVIKHLVTNCVIDVDSAIAASGVSYITYLAAPDKGKDLPLMAGPMHIGVFRDEYVLTNDGWRIKARRGSLQLKTG